MVLLLSYELGASLPSMGVERRVLRELHMDSSVLSRGQVDLDLRRDDEGLVHGAAVGDL